MNHYSRTTKKSMSTFFRMNKKCVRQIKRSSKPKPMILNIHFQINRWKMKIKKKDQRYLKVSDILIYIYFLTCY